MTEKTPSESRHEHTHILRVTLAVDDCIAYWNAPTEGLRASERTNAAFEGRWFGSKSESRVRTILSDMALRFDDFPQALTAIRAWKPPREVAPWICHFHTQLADPIYRRFTGEFLPTRFGQGYANVGREGVARWVQEEWPGRWSAATCIKFGGNMLATAFEAGLLKDRKDPRKLGVPRPPRLALEYLFYLLREVCIAGALLDSPYLRSVAPEAESRRDLLRNLGGVRVNLIAEVQNFEWSYPDLASWASAQRWSDVQGASA